MSGPAVVTCEKCGQRLPEAPLARPFRLNVSGWPILRDAGGHVIAVRTKKHVAVLVRLAVEPGRRFTRDYLAHLLWSERNDERRESHSLAQALSVWKALLGRGALGIAMRTVWLEQGIVDVVSDMPDVPFLDGFDIREAPEWQDWVDGRRAQAVMK